MGVVKGKRTTPKINGGGLLLIAIAVGIGYLMLRAINDSDWEQAQFWILNAILLAIVNKRTERH